MISNRRAPRRREAVAGNQRGAALIELAVALPLLALILVGTIDFGRAFRMAMVVTAAARAGALYGAQSTANAANTAGMTAAADSVLSGNGYGTGPATTAQMVCSCADAAGTFSTATNAQCFVACSSGNLVVNVVVTASRTFSLITPFPGVPNNIVITRGVTQRAE